ncbi:MAG: SRPBCC domain-containing protein [Actinobacteria bacterium]|nr:SRPBCC domain-containing protein [Actinomycetota bacterium]
MNTEPIQRSVTVSCDPDRAFRLFTEEIGSWWPVETHSRAASDLEGQDVKVEQVEFQTRAGGQVLEHLSDGQILPWGEVTVWEPPNRFVLAWHPSFAERPPTELEVRFTPRDGETLVELEHRAWERLGAGFDELRGSYADGWGTTLERFRAAAEAVA